jgi:hypothetical protein
MNCIILLWSSFLTWLTVSMTTLDGVSEQKESKEHETEK